MKYKIETSSHHSMSQTELCQVIDLEFGQDVAYETFKVIIPQILWNCKIPEYSWFEELREKGELTLNILAGGDENEDAEKCGIKVTFWYQVEQNGELNFGCGLGLSVNDTDRYYNRWFSFEHYVPDQVKEIDLLSCPKQHLVNRILELELQVQEPTPMGVHD